MQHHKSRLGKPLSLEGKSRLSNKSSSEVKDRVTTILAGVIDLTIQRTAQEFPSLNRHLES
jgi:hypothetical protein